MRLSQHLFARFPGGYLKAACLLLFTSYSVGVAAQYTPSEITLDNVDDTSELRTLHASGELDTRVSIALDSGELIYLELSYIQPFADSRRVLLDGKPIDTSQYETGRRYYRGSVFGDPQSYAFLSVESSGESSLYIDFAGNQYRGTISAQGSKLTVGQTESTAARTAAWPATDVVKVPELDPPSGPTQSQLAAPRLGGGSGGAESVTATAGWYGPWRLTVPVGQSYAGAVSRGPGVANVYIVPNGANPLDLNSCEYSKCFIENPEAGDYDVWVYKFGGEKGTPDEHAGATHKDGIEDTPDQAHVVIRRKPTDCSSISSALERVGNDLAVVHDVRMSQHDAFWRARRPRGVLQQCDAIGFDFGRNPIACQFERDFFRRKPGHGFQTWRVIQHPIDAIDDLTDAECHFRFGVLGDCLDSPHIPISPRRIRGDRNRSGVVAAKKRRNKLETGRIEEQRTLAAKPHCQQSCRNLSSLFIQLGIGPLDLLTFTIHQVVE